MLIAYHGRAKNLIRLSEEALGVTARKRVWQQKCRGRPTACISPQGKFAAVASSARRNESSQIAAAKTTDRGSWPVKSVVKLIALCNAWRPENACFRD
jgi:hypothetical protein